MTLRMTALPKVALKIALVAVGFTGVAQARGHGPASISFADLDVDVDGQVTAAEMEAQGAVRFAKMDTERPVGINTFWISAKPKSRDVHSRKFQSACTELDRTRPRTLANSKVSSKGLVRTTSIPASSSDR